MAGKNKMDLYEVEDRLIALSTAVGKEEDQLRTGGLVGVDKTILLRRIERHEKQRSSHESLASIYNENVNLNRNLIAKILEIEAMQARGVKEQQADSVMEEFAENIGEYR